MTAAAASSDNDASATQGSQRSKDLDQFLRSVLQPELASFNSRLEVCLRTYLEQPSDKPRLVRRSSQNSTRSAISLDTKRSKEPGYDMYRGMSHEEREAKRNAAKQEQEENSLIAKLRKASSRGSEAANDADNSYVRLASVSIDDSCVAMEEPYESERCSEGTELFRYNSSPLDDGRSSALTMTEAAWKYQHRKQRRSRLAEKFQNPRRRNPAQRTTGRRTVASNEMLLAVELASKEVSCMESFHDTLARFLQSALFTHAVGWCIIANMVSSGLETDYLARHSTVDIPMPFRSLHRMLLGFFCLEIILRIYSHGFYKVFCTHPKYYFDMGVIAAQCLHEWYSFYVCPSCAASHLRLLGLLRIVRIPRIFDFDTEFRMMMVSIGAGLRHLWSVVVLLLTMIYVLAVMLTQMVTNYTVQNEGAGVETTELVHFYGTVDRSVLSLYMMVSEGIHWGELLWPLMAISPWIQVLFYFVTAFSIFALLNCVTGVFVECALKSAKEDKHTQISAQIREYFDTGDEDEDLGDITLDEFDSKCLESLGVRAALRELDVDDDDALELFRLLDNDGSGTVGREEIADGILRLMGEAKALDLAIFVNETRRNVSGINIQLLGLQERIMFIVNLLMEQQSTHERHRSGVMQE